MSERREKERFVLAMREKARREATAPLIYYTPHKGQTQFHRALEEYRIVIAHPGNRWGKSHANAAEVVAHVYGYRPWLVPGLKLTPEGDYPPRSAVPPEYWIRRADGVPLQLPNKHLCATGLPARQGILGTMWPKIEAFFPPAVRNHPNFRCNRGAQSVPLVLRLPPELNTFGGEIHFASGEQDPMAYEAQSFGSASFDEPPKRAIWAPLWRGLTDMMARLWMTATPVGPNAPWIFEIFIMRGDELDVTICAIQGSIHDNPHLSRQSIHEFLEGGGFTEEERAARESGTWSHLSHRAFPQYDAGVHLVDEFSPMPPRGVIGVACDPAHRRPFFFVWGIWHNDGDLYIYDEWPHEDHASMRSSPYTIPDYARIVRAAEDGRHIHYRCLDPRFGKAAPRIKGEVHTSIQDDFERQRMFWDCRMDGAEREEIGIERIRQMLSWDRSKPLSPHNRPKLRVNARCKNIIAALAYSSFSSSRDPDVLPEKMAERYKDARDALRYLILFPWIPEDVHGDSYSYIDDETLRRENTDDWWQ